VIAEDSFGTGTTEVEALSRSITSKININLKSLQNFTRINKNALSEQNTFRGFPRNSQRPFHPLITIMLNLLLFIVNVHSKNLLQLISCRMTFLNIQLLFMHPNIQSRQTGSIHYWRFLHRIYGDQLSVFQDPCLTDWRRKLKNRIFLATQCFCFPMHNVSM